MKNQFETVCGQLGINPESSKDVSKEEIDRLATWIKENISSDICFSGEISFIYNRLLSYMKTYFNEFLPKTFGVDEQLKKVAVSDVISDAAMKGYNHYIEKLEASALDWNQVDQNGMSPLHWGALKGHSATVDVLLQKNVNLNLITKKRKRPLECSIFIPAKHGSSLIQSKMYIFKKLYPLTQGSNVYQDATGDSVLHKIALHGLIELLDTIEGDLVTLGKIKNNIDEYPIHTALKNGHEHIAMFLLEHDLSQIELMDMKKRTILHYACIFGGSVQLVQKCCDSMKDLDTRDINNQTPLDLAREAERLDVVEFLIEKGAKSASELHYKK